MRRSLGTFRSSSIGNPFGEGKTLEEVSRKYIPFSSFFEKKMLSGFILYQLLAEFTEERKQLDYELRNAFLLTFKLYFSVTDLCTGIIERLNFLLGYGRVPSMAVPSLADA